MGFEHKRTYRTNEQLRQIMDRRACKPSIIADRAGIRRDTFSQIMTSRRPIFADEVISICNAIGITPDELLLCEHSNGQPQPEN